MLNLLRLLFTLLVLLLIIPQTPQNNKVLEALHNSHFLQNYAEAKKFLNRLTWFSIFNFLLITFFTAV